MAGVTPNGIHYPDGASKAKNLGPELEQMALDIDTYIGSYLQPNGPIRSIIIGVAEDVVPPIVDSYLDEELPDKWDEIAIDRANVRAYPVGDVQRTIYPSLPLQWTWKTLSDPWDDIYTDIEQGSWHGTGQRRGDVPILLPDGTLRESQIPDSIARRSDVPTVPEVPEVALPSRILSRNVPILAARLATAKTLTTALPIVFVGSSTTYSMPGYVGPVGRMLQETWRQDEYTAAQRDSGANFTVHSSPGVHVYNAGEWGATAGTYLTDGESDRIAALDPALISHMIGSNDWRQGQDPAVYRSNLVARLDYLDAAIASPHQHVLVHQYERRDGTVGGASWDDFRQVLADLAAERPNVAFLDLSEAYSLAGSPTPDPLQLISSDDIHQTAQGYALMTALYAAFFVTA